MRLTIVVAVAALLVCPARGVVANKSLNSPARLEEKLLGAWKGQTGCAGRFLFRADGSYELKNHGPAPNDSAGVWKIRWDALPPTLVLTCRTSTFGGFVGKTTEVKLIRLDDESLAIGYANEEVDRYARVQK